MSSPSFRVANWDEYQHYRDRNPPWIKLHFALLSGETWVSLDDASRVLAVACMLLASRNGGRVPANPAYVKRVAYLNSLPDFKPLILSGFLLDDSGLLADASKLLDQRRGETETETEETPPTPRKRGSARSSRSEADAVLDGIFERFYTAYPRKKNKPAAHRAWRKQVRSEADAQQVSRGLKREMAEWQREGRPEDKIPYPATWLNAQDWRHVGVDPPAQVLDLNPHRHLRVWEIPIPEDVRWECEGRLEAGQVYRDGMWVKFEDLDPADPDYRKAVDRG